MGLFSKRWLMTSLAGLGLALSGFGQAQTNTPISSTPRVQQTGRLDYVAIGASFRTANGNASSPCTIKTGAATTAVGNGGSAKAEITGNYAEVLASARGTSQQVPTAAGTTVRAAYLYWVASQNDGVVANADNQVSFVVNGVANNVTASRVWTGVNRNGGSMGAFADVTSLVQANPNATMRMDGLDIQYNSEHCSVATVHGAWALYIVYENPGLSTKLISFYDGLNYIGGSSGVGSGSIIATGFSVPNTSSLDRVSKISILVADGDADSTVGDSLSLNSNLSTATTISTPNRPSGNFFLGAVTTAQEDGTEALQVGSATTAIASTTGGLDVATYIAAPAIIPVGSTSVTATIASPTSGGELLLAHNIIVMANTTNSNVRLVKTIEGGATTVTNGNSLKYILTVDNAQGVTEALNVVTVDTLPQGLTYNSTEISYDAGATWTTLSGVTTSVSGGVTTITTPAVRRIDPDGKVWGGTNAIATQLGTQNVRYRITATANGAAFGSVTNTATATSGVTETTTVADNTGARDVTINRRTNLVITKIDGVAAVNAGGTATYTIRVTNTGTDAVTGAVLRDPLATGLTKTAVACSATPGQCTAGTTPTITQLEGAAGYALPALASGQFYEITVTATVTATSGSVTNTATVAAPSGATDPDTSNNTASDVNTVAAADVTITKTGPAYAKPGGDVTYTLTVSNSGAATAAAVSVTDLLPPNVTYKSSAPAATVSGQNLTWSLGSLASGASQILTVVVTAPSTATLASTPAARTLTNTATVSTTTPESNPDNSASAVTQMVDAALTKTVKNVTQNTAVGTTGGGRPGEVLEYCIAFENIGAVALPNFVVTDQVPGNTNAQTGGYDAEEASAATGFGVKLTRGTTPPTTSYFTSAADTDVGALSSTGGSFGRGTMTVNLGALTVGDQGSVCFRTAIR